MNPANITIFGAGSVGCYVGGRLAATGARVGFIGRERIGAELREHGLHLTDWRGADLRAAPDRFEFATDPASAAGAQLVLVTVKSAATAAAGAALAKVLPPDALVVSFQNGLRNADVLRAALPGHTVLAGMVGFNVVHRGPGAFHEGSEGGLDLQAHPGLGPFRALFAAAGLPLKEQADMVAVQWAKLQINLNNAINALSNLPLKEELSQRAYRRSVALAHRELLAAAATAGIRLARLTAVPARWLPFLLELPDSWTRIIAAKILEIDPLARSSMWEDLEADRATEVDWLNGEVVQLAESQGRTAPVNARLVALIHAAERGGRRNWGGEELLAELKAAQRFSGSEASR